MFSLFSVVSSISKIFLLLIFFCVKNCHFHNSKELVPIIGIDLPKLNPNVVAKEILIPVNDPGPVLTQSLLILCQFIFKFFNVLFSKIINCSAVLFLFNIVLEKRIFFLLQLKNMLLYL